MRLARWNMKELTIHELFHSGFPGYMGLHFSKGESELSFSTRQGKEVPDQVHK